MSSSNIENIIEEIISMSKKGPIYFYDILKNFRKTPYRDVLIAWGRLRERIQFERDEMGRYIYPKDHDPFKTLSF